MPALSLRATYLIIIPTNLRRDIIPTIWIYRPYFHSTGLEKGLRSRFGSFPFFFFFSFLSLSLVSCIDYFIRSICLCFRRINKNSRMIPAALLPGENRKFAYSLFPQRPVVFIWDSKLRKMEQGCFYPVS